MSTFIDGAPPSVTPGPDDAEPVAGPSDTGPAWLQEEIRRRMAERRSGAGGRHARRDPAGEPPGGVTHVPRHSVATPGPGAPAPSPIGGPSMPPSGAPDRRRRPAESDDGGWSGPEDEVDPAPPGRRVPRAYRPGARGAPSDAPATFGGPAFAEGATRRPAPPRPDAPVSPVVPPVVTPWPPRPTTASPARGAPARHAPAGGAAADAPAADAPAPDAPRDLPRPDEFGGPEFAAARGELDDRDDTSFSTVVALGPAAVPHAPDVPTADRYDDRADVDWSDDDGRHDALGGPDFPGLAPHRPSPGADGAREPTAAGSDVLPPRAPARLLAAPGVPVLPADPTTAAPTTAMPTTAVPTTAVPTTAVPTGAPVRDPWPSERRVLDPADRLDLTGPLTPITDDPPDRSDDGPRDDGPRDDGLRNDDRRDHDRRDHDRRDHDAAADDLRDDEDDDPDGGFDDDDDGTVLWSAHMPPAAPDGTALASPALPADLPVPRDGEPGSPVRVKVILSERRSQAHPVRTVVDIQEGGAVGELLRSNLIGSQLTVALRFALFAALTLGLLPLAFAVFPEIGRTEVLGLRLPWLLLGVLVYPFLLGLGWWHTRTAERVEQNFADHVQD